MPEDEVKDTDLFANLYDVENPVDEYGDPVQQEQKPAQEQKEEPAKQEPAQEQQQQDEQKPAQEQPVQEQKPVQTSEENARFAEMRRQKQAQEQAERLAQERLQASPEYKMAQLLAQQYNMPVDQLLTQMQEAVLKHESETKKVPVEVLKEIQQNRQQVEALQQKLQRQEFDNWVAQQNAEKATIMQKYPVLTEQDVTDAMVYMLNDLRTTQMPLEQAVFAKHGAKITEHLRNAAKQEALAEVSGRKQGPLAPQSTKVDDTKTLTAEERAVAKRYHMTEEEYIKYRDE